MGKKKKTTVKVEENNVLNLKVAQQIIRNYQEDYGFADILDRFMRRELVHTGTIPICKTPNVLALGGANLDYDIIINPKTIVKCISKPYERHHGHNLDKDIFKYLVFELRNPVMLLKGSKDNTLVVVTDLKDREGRPVIVSVALDRKNTHHLANQITSAYGRENFNDYLCRQVKQGNLIAVNKNKANQMFRSAGLQLPIEETLISFDNSISYSMENVKGFSKENFKKVDNFNKDKDVGSKILINDVERLLDSFNRVLTANKDVVDMLRFFEYAGEEIYDSRLWREFQCDKEFLNDSEFIAKLDVFLKKANELVKDMGAKSRQYEEVHSHNFMLK